MSQIDKLNYIPLLFWFMFFFFFLYGLLLIYILPFIFGTLRVRTLFFTKLVNAFLDWFFFRGYFVFICFNSSHFSMLSFFFTVIVGLFYLDYFFFFFNGYLAAPPAESYDVDL